MRLIFTIVFGLFWLHASLFAQNPYYTVKFPDDKTYLGCGASVPVESPVITQYGCNLNVGVSRYDEVFNSIESGGCSKILRRWRLNYWCDYNPNSQPAYIPNPENTTVGVTTTGTPANHGYLEYIQIIMVRDIDPPVFTSCPTAPVLFCDYTNNNTALYGNACEGPVDLQTEVTDVCSGNEINLTYRLYLDLDGNGTMETFINSSSPTAAPIEKTVVGNAVRGKILFPANYQLPYGQHKVEWIANDNCGNEAVCKYVFEVRDCKKPTVVCKNGLSINIMQTGMITLWVSDFIQYVNDNCTPSSNIKTAIRKAGTGSGFPTGNTSVTFDCTELGTQNVEIWAVDAYGNADFCSTYVIVQDNSNSCVPTSSITGTILKPGGAPMTGVQVMAKNSNPNPVATTLSAENGSYSLPLFAGCYTLHTSSNSPIAPAEGVSTWDALLAGLHAEAVTYFDQPWQYAAADVNGDGWITSDDANAITMMAIGGLTQWPSVPVWQFIPTNSIVPIDEITIADAPNICITAGNPAWAYLSAVKTGDLDGSTPQLTGNDAQERGVSSKRQVAFTAAEKTFQAGETVDLTITTPSTNGLAGFQFALDYNPQALSVLQVDAAALPDVQYARFDAAHTLTAGWQNAIAFYPDGAALFKNKDLMTVQFTALQSGKLSEFVQLNAARLPTEVYTRDMQQYEGVLKFVPATAHQKSPSLLPLTPNPAPNGVVTVRYHLPVETSARLILSDGYGKIITNQIVDGTAGNHELQIALNTGNITGSYLMQLVTNEGITTRRVVR